MAGKQESVEQILQKKEAGETLSRSEAGKLGGTAYKAQEKVASGEVREEDTLEGIKAKQGRGEPLTPHERGILGGSARKGTTNEPE